MIDVSNQIYSELTDLLKVSTSSVYTNTPSSYPFVSIEEIDNRVYEQGSDCCETENFASIGIEINIYTKDPNKLSKNKELLQLVDSYMKSKGFVRNSKTSIQNDNETIYRTILRYSGVVSKDQIVYRR